MPMKAKMCYALKENMDKTKYSVKVFIQAPYAQTRGKALAFFVLFAYTQNPSSKVWEMTSDEHVDRNFRYVALLYFT